MTQIKLRRDTSANFASANPVLGVGEPAYETDTKKLKIGDGTTAYTQLEYFTAGGGGSANITATLPLKIVDGVISLEVDGQTIQIVDGKLHANIDELGNEVNSLTGEVTDLSGRVTAVEADIMNKASKSDLAEKQDKLNPVAPLGINQTTISNVTNGTFLTDTSVTLNSAFYINYTTDANARFLITASGVSGGATPTSFIQIPFTLGDLVSFPDEDNGDSGRGLIFGYWKDNLFYPTMLYKTYTTYGSGSNSYAPFAFVSEAGKSSLERIATYYGSSSAVSKSTLEYHESIPLNATNYIQVTKNAGVPTVNMWFTISGASYPNRGYIQRMSTSDTTVLENFNKTNVCLFLSDDTSKAINLTKVTRRELGDTVLSPTVDALTTALNTYSNSFDATAKVVTNDLSLSIGSGLAITDGKLTASSTAPANMMTTDTAQTISGQKEFDKTILFLSNNDLIRAQQSSSYRNGAGLSMGANSTSTDGGVFAPQWKIYNTSGDVDRTETIITTYNQSKLNSSNFNTANKLVRLDSDGKLPAIDGSNLTNLPSGGSTPTNMVTTDTNQTITGLKTFGGTDLSKILLEGSKSVIGFRQNSDSLPTTLIGGFFDSNGKKSISIGSTDHETLSLNAKSVQDASGNKFLTSGNVTASNDITITDTTDGIQISATGAASMPSDRYIDLTLGASGTTYTAPANGYFSWSGMLKGTVASFNLYNETTRLGTQSYSTYDSEAGMNGYCFIPVRKGDVVACGYYASTSLTTKTFRFIYAEGSK